MSEISRREVGADQLILGGISVLRLSNINVVNSTEYVVFEVEMTFRMNRIGASSQKRHTGKILLSWKLFLVT